MIILLAGLGFIIFTGIASLFIKDGKTCTRFGAAGVIIGSLAAVTTAIKVLFSGETISFKIPWQVPYGSFYIVIDSISALFLIIVFMACSIAAVYGCGYMAGYKQRRLSAPTFFFNMLVASMAMVVMARNGVLFLVVWEIMSLASYFLVTFDHEHESVRQAGWIYIVATHIGTAFLLAFFVCLGKYNGTMDFDNVNVFGKASSVLFLLALVGFGTKAGIMPMHVWLPEAHPAAPSHISAVMSGVMIKMGVYGIIRTISILPEIQLWWGWLLVILGIVSGLLGILFALAQHDIKRMLAYSSVENIGIILIGLGLGLIGLAGGSYILAVLGFAGALLHIINHSLFKSLLFMGAGAVVHSTETRRMDLLGGLIKRMPLTAGAFVIGAIAICGLPPLNGFIGEFLLYYSSFAAALSKDIQIVAPAVAAIAALAMIGGFAVAAFTKVFGIVFLGEPRTSAAANAHEADKAMIVSMWLLAVLCILIGITAPLVLPVIISVVMQIVPAEYEIAVLPFNQPDKMLWWIVISSIALFILISVLAMIRRNLLKNKTVTAGPTWDCGYAAPTPRIQYTSSSFSQPIVDMFKNAMYLKRNEVKIDELFPKQAQFESHTPDVSNEYIYRPVFKWIDRLTGKMQWLQYGVVQMYVLYIAITLIILLVWKL
ncbi:MAG: hypothetical protein A2Y10_20400 [Planctomycetes bacterium GWF2_41_51]|nr:MAG: hypothetical protein A2Y10_20400 [Planctomycetes bacterium GWF2_41_51]HBG25724.1 hydrogenase [Phycisphaerales bacterium]